MPRIEVLNLSSIENVLTSPSTLRSRIGDVILHSSIARARVESLNPETGEYRVVLQGTLDRDTATFEEK